MVAQGAYSVAMTDEEIVVRLRAGLVDRESLVRFLDYLELESIRRKSQLTEAAAAQLSQEIDESVCEQLGTGAENAG